MLLLALLQQPERGFDPSDAARQFGQFLAWFAIFGALGFRWVVMRASALDPMDPLAAEDLRTRALRAAATIGLGGALLLVADLLPWNGRNAVTVITAAVAALAYAVARRGRDGAWVLALLAGLVLTFHNVVTLRWATLVNPIHMTAAALWIGTLFVLVSAGLPAILRAPLQDRRGALVAGMIARFSPLALVASGLLVLTGVITAWRHLGALDQLWRSSYGIALLVKLVFVALVVALGAWNWRRMSPRLGTEEAAHAIRRSATGEVGVALVVLVITAILVSLPSPAEKLRRRGPPRAPAAATAPAAAGAPAAQTP